MKIGVFDSGIGGLSIARAVERALPKYEVLFRNDKENVPYGLRTPKELITLVKPILDQMVREECALIIIACNTVTTTIIKELRSVISVPLVGIEPMVKPAAAMTVSRVIAVCATPTTLHSKRYKELKDEYTKAITVLEPDCSDWSYMIETNQIDHKKIEQRIVEVCDGGADVIVLGCTHYHWIAEEIDEIAKNYHTRVIHPEYAVIEQVKRVLAQLT